jgi:predicted nucleotidyltransferase component of viral defense system
VSDGAGDIYRALRSRARERKLNTQQQLELYVHERLLARIAASDFAGRLVLKGGMLLAALDIRDVTRDADIAATAISNDPDSVRQMMMTIVDINLADEVEFDADAMSIATMRDDDQYHGLRIKLPCTLHTARLVAQVDMSFGDPITGMRRRIPSMLADGFEMLTYSVEALLAEKIVTMISRGDANTRDRDFGDVWLISQQMSVDAGTLMSDMRHTADHRDVDLLPLSDVLRDIREARRASWQRYRTRTGLTLLPTTFDEALDLCHAFADPILHGDVRDALWSPTELTWMSATTDDVAGA